MATKACMFYIYEIFNDVTQRRYIGVTKNPQKRFKSHLSFLRNHKHTAENIVSDYIKYGEEHFFFRLIDEAETKEEGLKKEKRYILKFQSYTPENGYNGNDPRWSKKHSPGAIKDSDLKRKIKKQGYKLCNIPCLLGISYSVFVSKMNNPDDFTNEELQKLNKYLEINQGERWRREIYHS